MATADEYAQWIVKNQDKKGTPEFNTVAQAYQQAKTEESAGSTVAPIAQEKPPSRMESLVQALSNPDIPPNKTRVVGPMLVGGLGETIKGVGAASQLLPESIVSPQTSQNIIDV